MRAGKECRASAPNQLRQNHEARKRHQKPKSGSARPEPMIESSADKQRGRNQSQVLHGKPCRAGVLLLANQIDRTSHEERGQESKDGESKRTGIADELK